MNSPSKRRWLRFSLRTLFVVVTTAAVGVGWLVYQLDWIRQRHVVLADSVMKYRYMESNLAEDIGLAAHYAPWPLAILGEEGVCSIEVTLVVEEGWLEATDFYAGVKKPLTPEHHKELDRIQRLFPEAEVEPSFVIETTGER